MKKQAVCWKPAECVSGGRWLYRLEVVRCGTNVIRKWCNDGCCVMERWMDERTEGQTDAWMSTAIGFSSLDALPNLCTCGGGEAIPLPSR